MTALSGHVLPNIAHSQDLGSVDDSLPLRLYMVLRRTPEQQADLDNLIARQQQPDAAEYHHWLTPQQFGQRFGAAQQDIAQITSWLQSQGLHVNGVLNNASFIDFSATAGQVFQAFHTRLHNINANGETYPALLQDPMIPAALAPAIAGIHGLNQKPPHASLVNPHQTAYDLAAHRWLDFQSPNGVLPAANLTSGSYNVAPQDLYTIYNVNKVLNPTPAGLNDLGAGQSIAVIEGSDFPYGAVDPATGIASGGDVATFRSLFGIAGTLNMHVYHGYGAQSCGDPGILTNGSYDLEAALDAEWANALAPSANLIVVSCGSITTALTAVIDYNLASIISLSFNFGGDKNTSQSTYSFFDSFWAQAAAQGQTVFVSSGDSGSDDSDQGSGQAATSGLNVNVAAASPLVTAAGGTDFQDLYDAPRGGVPVSTYWNTTNGPFYQTALSYVPETAWNNSCASSILAAAFGYQGADYCAKSTGGGTFLGGSGGFSSHYAAPAYQSGVPGYSGAFRALPDISGFASNGDWGHALLFCDSVYSYWSCNSTATVGGAGGTSFVAPYLAGVTALLNSYTGSRQGVLNPALYALAKAQFSSPATSSACYANGQTSNTGVTVGLPASQCIFNDVTTGNNDVQCGAGSLNCYTDPGAAFGMLSLTNAASLTVAYPSTPGYDEATGIGSVNVYNLLTKWNAAFSSSVTLSATRTAIFSDASTSLTATVTSGVPAGYVDTPPALTGSVNFSAGNGSLGTCVLSGGACSLTVNASQLQFGANSINATFQGSGTYPASASTVLTVTVNGSPQTIVFSSLPNVNLGSAPFTLSATASSGLPVSYSSSTTTVCAVAGSTVTILAAGTCTITASQSGNATYAAATPVTQSFTVAAAPQVGYVAYWGVNNTGVTVSWSTDVPATAQLAYGTTTALGQTSPLQTALTQSHGVVLTTLSPGTTYYFVAQSTSATGATGSSPVYSFITTGGTATTPAPVITSVMATGITGTSATITWTTDQASTSQVNYGTTTSYGSASTVNTSLVTSHTVTLTGLNAGATYNFDVVSANASSLASTSSNYTFTTTGAGPTGTSPQVGYVVAWGINNTGVTVTWSTDIPATTQLAYGTTAALGQLSPIQTTLSASHGVVLANLNPGTTYYFVAQSTSAGGATGYSTIYSFSTTGTATNPAPVISSVTSSNITTTSATITWTTDEPGSSQVNYGTTMSYGSSTAINQTLVTAHSVTLTGLTPATTYNFQVLSANANLVSSTSGNYTFSTIGQGTPTPGTPPYVGYVAYWGVNNTGVTISWSTDVPATTQLAYGATNALGQLSTLQTALSVSHGVVLTGLNPGTTYYFVAQSTAANGATGYSTTYNFTTSGITSTPAPIISGVAATGITTTAATITWTTDQASSSQVNYGTTSAYGSASTPNTALVTSHSVTLTGLTPGTTYDFDVVSANAGSTPVTSANSIFTTASAGGTPPNVGYVFFYGVNNTGVTISWSTDVPATTQLAYGTTTAMGQLSPLQTSLAVSHGLNLTGLNPGTTYYFVAQSTNAGGVTGYSSQYSFTTTGSSAPVISNIIATPSTGNTATISWSTSTPTLSYVQFGTTAGSYNMYSAQTALTSNPQCKLPYVPSGVIHYQLVSTDAYGTQTLSVDATFLEP